MAELEELSRQVDVRTLGVDAGTAVRPTRYDHEGPR